MNLYCRLVPRLNGAEIEKQFDYYRGLAEKGVAGFIVFGGELETVREGLRELRRAAGRDIVIASDLEQGLGQQIAGGTLFPPALAIASAAGSMEPEASGKLLVSLFTAMAVEARHAGINTILAPVLDINTNPENPIIATRSFGEDPGIVSELGCAMVRTLREHGLLTCGKHFPGHGDTAVDSHMGLPLIQADLHGLEGRELIPFRKAILAGVDLIMLGHLRVPALDPSGMPASISGKAVAYLRQEMGFSGTIITDAMNMGGLSGFSEEEACRMALDAGVDLILHPTDPDRIAHSFGDAPVSGPMAFPDLPGDRVSSEAPDFGAHARLAAELARIAIRTDGILPEIRRPYLLVLDEDGSSRDFPFIGSLMAEYKDMPFAVVTADGGPAPESIPPDCQLVVAVFSSVRAWKKGARPWLRKHLSDLAGRICVTIVFGNPYVLGEAGNRLPTKVIAFWDALPAQRAVADLLIRKRRPF